MQAVPHHLIESKWVQLPLCLALLWALSSLAKALWLAPELTLPINLMFLPDLLSAIVFVVLVSGAMSERIRLKYCSGYLMLFVGVMLLLNGTIMTANILHPQPKPAQTFSFGNWRPMPGMTQQDIDIWEEFEGHKKDPHARKRKSLTDEQQDSLIQRLDQGLNALGLKSAVDIAAKQVSQARDAMPQLSPSTLIFLSIFGSAVLIVLGGAILEGRAFHGARRNFAELEARFPHLKGLEARYRETLIPWLTEQERRRLSAVRMRYCAYAVGAPLVFYCTLNADFASTVIVLPVTVLWAETQAYFLRASLKDTFPQKLCDFFGLGYDRDAGDVRLRRLEDSSVLPTFTTGHATDEISGAYRGVSLSMYKAKLVLVSRWQRRRVQTTVFRGAILELTFPQAFAGRTKVLKDRGKIMNAAHALFESALSRIGIGRADLERKFEVYTNPGGGAQVLATPEVVDGIAELSRILAGEISIQAEFGGNTALMAVDYVDDFFDYGLSTPLTDPSRVCRFAEGLAAVFDVIDLIARGQHAPTGRPRLAPRAKSDFEFA